MKTKFAGAVATLALLLTPAGAQVTTWAGGTGAWDVGANWTGGAVPLGTGTAIVNNGLANIALGTTGSVAILDIADGIDSTGTVTIDGFLYTNAVSYIGGRGDGTIIIGSSGTYKINNSFRVGGYTGAGDSPGGNFLLGSGNGHAVIYGFLDGAGKTIAAGFGGTGRIDVMAGGTVSNNNVYIGDHVGASGTINIWGSWVSKGNGIYLGDSGTMGIGSNVINIHDGGSFVVNATANGGGFRVSNGANASGIVNIAQGGTMALNTSGSATHFYIGTNAAGAYGEVNVDGYLSYITTYTAGDRVFAVGYGGNTTNASTANAIGVLNIGQTGTVYIQGATEVSIARMGVGSGTATNHYVTSASGTVNVAGLLNTNGTQLLVGRSGDGYLNIAQTGTVLAGNIRVSNGNNVNGISYSEINIEGYLASTGWLDIAGAGNAVVNVLASGTVITADDFTTGRSTGSKSPINTGTLNIWGYALAGDQFVIGNQGRGYVNIYDGATVIAKTSVDLAMSTGTSSAYLNLAGGVLQTPKIIQGSGSTATILFNGGTIRAGANADNFFVNFPVVALGGGSLTLDTQAYAITITNALAGTSSATLDKTGVGTLKLTADSSAYSGALNIRSGILASGNDSAKLGGNVTIFDGAALDLRNADLGTTGNLTFAEGAVWAYSLDTQHQLAANNLTIAGDGTLYLDLGSLGIADLTMPAAYTLGTYTTGNGISNLANWTVTGGTIGYGAAIDTSSVANTIKVNVNTAGVDFLYWQGGDGNWDSASATWKLSGTAVKWGYGGLGVFDSGAGTVTITGIQTFDGLQFDVDGYTLLGTGTLVGNFLTGDGSANFNVTNAAATATINTAVVGTNLKKAGLGSLTLGGPVTASGTTIINGGTLSIGGQLDSTGVFVGNTGDGTLEILSGGVVRSSGANRIGFTAGVNGSLLIRDGGLWQSTGGVTVGYSGNGKIHVAQGGALILDGACLYIADQVGSSGAVTIDGYYQSGGNGTYYQPIGYRGVGAFNIGLTGTARTGGFEIAREAGATGSGTVAGLWQITGVNNTVIGKNGGSVGALVIESTGTIINSTTAVGNYTAIGLNAGSSGTVTVHGYFDTGTRSNGTNDGNLIIGHSGTGHMFIEQGATVLASGTGSTTAALTMGKNAGSYGYLNVAGLLDMRGGGYTRIGIAGAADLDIASTGTMLVGHYFQIGYGAPSILNIAEGGALRTGQFNTGADIGYAHLCAVTANVAGLFDVNGSLHIAPHDDETSILNIASTGTVTTRTYTSIGHYVGTGTGIGTINVDGYLNTPTYLLVGGSGAGVMNIAATGTVIVGSYANVAANANSSGTANVAGFWQVGSNLRIGQNGFGALNVEDSGTVTVGGIFQIGSYHSGTALIDGYVHAASDAYVGTYNGGTGVATIGQDGVLNAVGKLVIGHEATASGTLFVEGLAKSENLMVGSTGTGVLDIQSGGTVAVSNTASIGYNAAGSGMVNVAGFFDIGNDLNIGTAGSGMLGIKSGGEVRVGGTTFVGATGTISVLAGDPGANAAKLGGDVIIQSGGMLDLRTGPLSITDNITFENGAFWHYSLTGKNELDVSGTITIGGFGTLYIDPDGLNIETGVPGVYTLANYQDIVNSGSLASWLIMGPGFSHDGVLSASTAPGSITLNIGTAKYDILVWKGGDGDWGVLDTDWRREGADANWNLGSLGLFQSGTGTVTVTDRQTISVLQFDDVDYTLEGPGSLAAYGGNAFINTTAATGTATINVAFETETLEKTGPGTLVLGGAAKFTDNVSVESGALEIAAAGTLDTGSVEISATGAGRTASVTVAGVMTNTGTLLIGGTGAGTGALVVADGGVVNQGSDTFVGSADNASGLLHVENNGVFTQAAGNLILANEASSSGTLIVEGSGTVSVVGDIIIGAHGSGTALIDGELSSGTNIYIGANAGAQGVATIGQNGFLDAAADLIIGRDATATGTLAVVGNAKSGGNLYLGQNDGSVGNLLDIASTGTVTVGGTTFVGNAVDSLGTAKVSGVLDATGGLMIGNLGTGVLEVVTGGTVQAVAGLRIGDAVGSSGTVSVGGVLNVSSNMYIGNAGKGSLEVLAGGTVSAGSSRHYIGDDPTMDSSSTGVGSGVGSLIIHRDGYFTSGGINVGRYGAGELTVKTGGTLVLDHATLYVAGDLGYNASSSGIVNIDGYYQSGTNGTYYQPVGYGSNAVGVFNVGATGTVFTGQIKVGIEAGSTGTVNVAGFWQINGGSNEVGSNGNGSLIIGQSGTMIIRGGNNDDYLLMARYAGSSGEITVHGLLDTGTRGHASNANLYVGYQTTDVMTIESTGTVIASGTGAGTRVITVGHGANSHGTLNVKGYLAVNNGEMLVGNAGTGILNIASTGTVTVDGPYRQGVNGTLIVDASGSRTSPYITAERASLSGTLALDGASFGYGTVTKASELTDFGALVLKATSGTIAGNFTSIVGIDGGVTPGYITIGGQSWDNGDGTASYYAGYRLAWNSLNGAHGTFELSDGETFEVDTPLANRVGEGLSADWDGKSLTKLGGGTLILSAQNIFTGTLNVAAGTVQLGGPAAHNYRGGLVNNGVFDFGDEPLVRADPATYRTVSVGGIRAGETGLSGNGSILMRADPGTGASDRLIVNGNAEGTHNLVLSVADGATAPTSDSPAPVLATISGENNATFTGGLDFEGTNYAVVQSVPGTIILATNGQSDAFSAISSVHGAQSVMWFASQDNLYRRIGELRSISEEPSGKYSVWLRARAENSSFSSSTNMRPFEMDLYGFEIGADKTIAALSGRMALGVYLGYGHASQDFDARNGSADGDSDQLSLGAYAAWMNTEGWFANATLTGALYDNEFTSTAQNGSTPTKGNYDDTAIGLSLEVGKRIALDQKIGAGWFAEPSTQLSLVYLMRDDYTTKGDNLAVDSDDATIARLRATLRAGRAWKLANSHIEIAGRIGAAYEDSSGGKIRVNDGTPWRPNVDGARGEAGVGLIWRPTAAGQLYFDYEFATGEGYQKPWSVSLGYRHAF
ncbi:autotransporter outer membrane beta-barrel domain-containing protein [Ereboglobus luteus]|nr:autotransporter outer membrane beta-barrel domain-containing protein [Ereboglobus luteus]